MDMGRFFTSNGRNKLYHVESDESIVPHPSTDAGREDPGREGFKLRVHRRVRTKMRAGVKELTSRRYVTSYGEWKRKLKQFITGWGNYYKLADMKKLRINTDEWMRRRIRRVFWKKWKRVRTKYRNLRKLGIDHNVTYMTANCRSAYWYMSNTPAMETALSNKRLEKAGFVSFWSYRKSVSA